MARLSMKRTGLYVLKTVSIVGVPKDTDFQVKTRILQKEPSEKPVKQALPPFSLEHAAPDSPGEL